MVFGIEPKKCTISKNLTRNALTTTDVYLIPVDMKKLGICILPDCEDSVYEDVTMIKPYIRTSEEEKLYEELKTWIEADKAYYKKMKEVSEAVNSDDCSIEKKSKDNRQKKMYKTVNQWKEAGRKVKAEELENPKVRTYVDTKSKYYALYIEERTDEIDEDQEKEIPITECSTGLHLTTEKNHKCIENVFDGMGLVSKELGEKFKKFIKTDYPITGYQLRLPAIKCFFPIVGFKSYF
ncbi:hypothetical protein ACLMAB_19710 [Brevibacillus laterosporus]